LRFRSEWEALTQAGHAYCVWETDGNIYGYDRNSGSFPLPVYTRDAQAIAIVLAQELSNVLKEPLSVANAEFIEPNQTRLLKFSGLESPASFGLALVGHAAITGASGRWQTSAIRSI
jgi:hypothetical protein